MTFKTISVIIISLLLAHAPLSPAAKAETTLDSLVALALENNPELAGLKDRHAAANFDAKASGALPDPRVSLEFMGLPRSSLSLGESPMSGIALGISQMIPWPAKLRAMRAMADLETDLKGLQAARQRNRLIREVKETYYEYSALVLTRELLEQNIHLLEAMTGSAQAGYAAGLGTGRDLLAGQIRQTQLENRRRQIDLMLQMSLNRLVQLTGAEIQGDIKLAESLPEIEWAEDSVKATGIRKNPEF